MAYDLPEDFEDMMKYLVWLAFFFLMACAIFIKNCAISVSDKLIFLP